MGKPVKNSGAGIAAFLTIFCVGALPAILRAETTFRAVVDRTQVTMNETLTLQLIISGGNLSMNRPALPPIPGFQVFSSGQSQNFSFMNGQVSSQVTYSYALAPQAPGDYIIPSFSIDAAGQTLSTEAITIKVLSGAAPSAGSSPPAGAAPGADSSSQRPDLFVTTSVDKKTAYVGEAVTLTFRFYSRARLIAQPGYSPPATTGFLTEDLPPQRQYTESIDGRPTSVVELKTALFPAAPGRAVIGPAALECRVQDFSPNSFGADPFDDFFTGFFGGGRSVTLRSDPIPMQILPLPENGRPGNFKGDVGRYTIEAALDRTTARLHEPVTLTVTVSGEGNIKAVSAPPLPPLDGFRLYETLSSLNVSKEDYRVRGSKVFKTILKPDVTGRLRIPPIEFSTFDPLEKIYRTARSGAVELSVEGPAPGAAAPQVPVLEGVKVVGQDIRFIKSRASFKRRRAPFHRTRPFTVLNLLPAAAFATLWIFRNLRSRSASNTKAAAFRRAHRRAEKDLRRAAAGLGAGRLPEYYAQLQRILRQYLADKQGFSVPGLTWDQASGELPAAVAEETRRTLQFLWEDFDRARFSPSMLIPEEAEKHGKRLARVLKDLEREWRRS